MYKKISEKEKQTRIISEVHQVDNYLTKETSENISLAISKLKGKVDTETVLNERVYYFLLGNGLFTIDGEKIEVKTGDVLYISKNSKVSFKGEFEAVVINTPAFGVIK